jgi:phosphohistidine phosphatase
MSPRQLVLVRHAKTGDGAVDFDRSLTDRGERDALAIGQWLRRRGTTPDHVVVSPARRTRQTWERASLALPAVGPATFDARIYDNTVGALTAVLRETPPDAEVVVLVGHNPSITLTARSIDDGGGTELDDGFSTSSVAVFALSVPFSDLAPGTATLVDFTTARG